MVYGSILLAIEGEDDVMERPDVVIALHGNLGAGGNSAGTVACQKHELEAVRNLVDAVLDGDASHQGILVFGLD